ncbi:MAG: hypothetical protein WDM80_02985 [Limisphaerales bacterium]
MNESENKLPFKPDVGFWVVSLSLIGLLFILVWPISRHPNPSIIHSAAHDCINNLKQIDLAKNQWAIDHNAKTNEVVTMDALTDYLGSTTKLICPSGGTYIIGKISELPTCSLGTTVTPAHVLPWPHSGDWH